MKKETTLKKAIHESWQKIAPFWPLKSLVGVNPLQGFEDIPFEHALKKGAAYFQQTNVPCPLKKINAETIKWCQIFFDTGQATITMPFKNLGFYTAWCKLAVFDQLLGNTKERCAFLAKLPEDTTDAILFCLEQLKISEEQYTSFITLMLTTLPGWAAHVQYQAEWRHNDKLLNMQHDFLAVRLALTCILWPEAKKLLDWHESNLNTQKSFDQIKEIYANEQAYQKQLITTITQQNTHQKKPDVQFLFCIDVRSEPFRRAIEQTSKYETFGIAGFFTLPIAIENSTTDETVASCPVLLKPQETVTEKIKKEFVSGYTKIKNLKKVYQATKYTIASPFALIETLGSLTGLWMATRTIRPRFALYLKELSNKLAGYQDHTVISLENMSIETQCLYAENILKAIGLTDTFAPFIVLCGHASSTENNPQEMFLNCGACGGQGGGTNARVAAAILNNQKVRTHLAQKDIIIPDETQFTPAQHDTATDQINFYDLKKEKNPIIQTLKKDLAQARSTNNRWRYSQFTPAPFTINDPKNDMIRRSTDWSEVRPEWGLARNAGFVIGPRNLTMHANLEGRTFLHSYEWNKDHDGKILEIILTAPMVVAQWINSQYLFSTIDNKAYGTGSKITQNIVGKIGVMQGNASDLMYGLSLQSVYSTETQPYHQPCRLTTLVHASRTAIDQIVARQDILKKLFSNEWVTLLCFDPTDSKVYRLKPNLTWQVYSE